MKLQKKLPTSMLSHYHRWVFENHKVESVEVLREWFIQEAEFQLRALETVQGLTAKVDVRSNTRGVTFFGRPNTGFKTNIGVRTESQVAFGNQSCKLCGKHHGVWACNEFKDLEIPKRWDCAKN